MIFHDITLRAGERISTRRHDTEVLDAKAVDHFVAILRGHVPGGFRLPVEVPGFDGVELSWTVEPAIPTGALATFWYGGGPMTTSALFGGGPDEDTLVGALQDLVVQLYRGTPAEPAFDLAGITERPLLATLVIPRPDYIQPLVRRKIELIASAETYLAAAFFTKGGA